MARFVCIRGTIVPLAARSSKEKLSRRCERWKKRDGLAGWARKRMKGMGERTNPERIIDYKST